MLIVEDDNILRNAMVEHLKTHFNVLEAGGGEKGLKEIIEHRPDVVVLDLLLPGMTGFEVLEQVRANPDPAIAQTKVIIMSNLSPSADILKAKQLSVSFYLTKSATGLDELEGKIQDALRGIVMQ